MWCCRETGKVVWETRRPFSLRALPVQHHPSRAAARSIISPRRICAGAILSFMKARISGGAVSGEPELNGGAGLYSSRSWMASAVGRSTMIDTSVSAKSIPAVTPEQTGRAQYQRTRADRGDVSCAFRLPAQEVQHFFIVDHVIGADAAGH